MIALLYPRPIIRPLFSPLYVRKGDRSSDTLRMMFDQLGVIQELMALLASFTNRNQAIQNPRKAGRTLMQYSGQKLLHQQQRALQIQEGPQIKTNWENVVKANI